MTDPDLKAAKEALERLSADPFARELATEREIWAWNHETGLRLAGEAGEARGRAEGERALLRRLLAARFGEIPHEVDVRLAGASEAEVEAWVDRLLGAASLDDVFS